MEPVTNWAALAAIAGVCIVMSILMIIALKQEEDELKDKNKH